jgi:lipopolysaccharide/colanic/teichoic acid biosynthesis glycosyltransferase
MSTLSESGTDVVFADFARSQAAIVASSWPLEQPLRFPEEGALPESASFAPIRAWYVPLKSSVEWMIALALFVFTSPVMIALAALVKMTSRGPAFYSQTRLGRHGRHYRIYKLRTMAHNCEATTGAVWARKNDPRITRLGRILRDTHLDELPQLVNILQGHMGLIGPRPERPELVPALVGEIPSYTRRLQVKPGVTGLAQMLLPADSDLHSVRRKIVHDLHYIKHLSPLMDLRIALCTVCYFSAAAAKAGCKLLVGGYGKAIAAECALPEPDQDVLFDN